MNDFYDIYHYHDGVLCGVFRLNDVLHTFELADADEAGGLLYPDPETHPEGRVYNVWTTDTVPPFTELWFSAQGPADFQITEDWIIDNLSPLPESSD